LQICDSPVLNEMKSEDTLLLLSPKSDRLPPGRLKFRPGRYMITIPNAAGKEPRNEAYP